VPLDVHVLRFARRLGLTAHQTATWEAALDVTRALARLDPVDPVRYDFALAHLGISGACTGRAGDCTACTLALACDPSTR
jgi:endonuclease III